MPRQYGTTGLQAWAAAPTLGPAGSTYYDSTLKLHFMSDGLRWFEVSSDYIASRGPGLVTNGSALLGNNYNWRGFYDLVTNDHPVGAAGSFQARGSAPLSTLCEEYVPVDPAGSYDMTFAYRQVAGTGRIFYSYLAPYDAQKSQIAPQFYMEQANTRTTLAVPLNPGDTTITLASGANWNNSAASPTYDYMRSIIIWAYTDGNGFTWPPGTYSRLWYSGLWNPGGITGNVITLTSPWAGSAYPAGTVVANGSSGGNFMYGAAAVPGPPAWTNYSFRYSGVHTDLTQAASRKFPAGTSFIMLGFLHNFPDSDPTAISRMCNVNLVQVSAAAKQGLPPAGTAGQVLTKNSPTDYDAVWASSTGGPPSGAAGGDLSGSYPNPQIAAGTIVDGDIAAGAAIAQSKIAGLSDTGWVVGGSGSSVLVANATNVTLVNSWARALNGRVQFFIQFTMKVTSSAVTGSMDITNLPVGTAAAAFIPAGAPMDQPLNSVGGGRGVFAYISPNGIVQIAAIGGTTALAVNDTITIGGSYLL